MKLMTWCGRILSALLVVMLALGAVMNLVRPKWVIESSAAMGYRESVLLPLGIVVLASVMLYAIPRTAVLGAILLTGYLGGAVATHVIHGDGVGQVVFPAIFGALVWLGLFLRDARVRAMIPIRH